MTVSRSMLAYVAHVVAIGAFAAFGSLMPRVPIVVFALLYGLTLLAALLRLSRAPAPSSPLRGAQLAMIHTSVSAVLLLLGHAAEAIIPVVGGALSFVSSMLFFVLNYPGLPLAKLLPYPGDPPALWVVLHDFVLVGVTAAWLLLMARVVQTSRLSNREHG